MLLPNDPNDWRFVSERREGMSFIPVAIDNGRRNGARERILAAQAAHPGRLNIRYDTLVTRVLFDGDRAVGVAPWTARICMAPIQKWPALMDRESR